MSYSTDKGGSLPKTAGESRHARTRSEPGDHYGVVADRHEYKKRKAHIT